MKLKLKSIIHYMIIGILSITLLLLISSKSQKAFDLIGYRTYTVLSGSMEPEFYPGDIVIVKSKNKSELKVNDIVTFIDDGDIVTHRIMKETEEGYITKGDNNDVEDATTLQNENIIGEVLMDIPKLGYLMQFLSKPIVIAGELILLGIFIMIYSNTEQKEEKQKKEEKNEN